MITMIFFLKEVQAARKFAYKLHLSHLKTFLRLTLEPWVPNWNIDDTILKK
jgi:hypothetical protein